MIGNKVMRSRVTRVQATRRHVSDDSLNKERITVDST